MKVKSEKSSIAQVLIRWRYQPIISPESFGMFDVRIGKHPDGLFTVHFSLFTLRINLFKFKVLPSSKLHQVLEQVSFQGVKVLDFEIAVGQDVFNFEIMTFAMVDEPVFFAVAENIKRKSGHNYKSSSRSSIRIEDCGTMKYFSFS